MNEAAKEYLEKVTKIRIKSDKVHLYNVEAKDMLSWMSDFAEAEAKEFAEWCGVNCYQYVKDLGWIHTSTGIECQFAELWRNYLREINKQ